MHNFPLFHISTVGGSKKSFLLVILVILVLFPSLAILGGLLVQFLWNQSIASIFNLKEITWIQAVALLFLSKILFGVLQANPKDYEDNDDLEEKSKQEIRPLPPPKEVE